MKPPKLNQPMMNVPVSHMGQEHTKQISLSSKPRCVKIIPKWAFVRTELNVSSLMAHMNLFDLPKTLKKLIEQGNVNRFGKKEHVVTVFDANFCTTTQKWTNKRIFNKWPTISFVLRHPKAKADWLLFSKVIGIE